MSLLARYNEYIDRLKKSGAQLTEYRCPDCGRTIEAIVPPKAQVYGSMVECPHCRKMHFKAVFDDGAVNITRRPFARRARSAGGES
jgi:putative FmdB family regulatory protein